MQLYEIGALIREITPIWHSMSEERKEHGRWFTEPLLLAEIGI